MRASSLALALILAAVPAGSAAPSQDADPQRFVAGTTAILVDVVVRDRQGRPVTDLTASDFELYEDEVRQTIGSMTMVAPGRQSGTVSGSDSDGDAGPSAERHGSPRVVEAPTFVALVFDRLSPEARALAYQGAQAYLESSRADDFAGVFLSDLHLETIQTYTNDREKLRAAIRAAASRATSSFNRDANRIGGGGLGDGDPGASPTAGAESEGPRWRTGVPGPDAIDPNRRLQEMADRMERTYERLMRDQQGLATTNSLLALIAGLSVLPGRKTVVFFAEALALPQRVMSRFDAVVANANRSNVSVYAIDAAGLRVHSGLSESVRRAFGGPPTVDSWAGSDFQIQDQETREDSFRRDPDVSLRMLAERTGGFLINNTNDLRRGFREIDADRRFHYLLAYTPSNSEFRGEWRHVTVKVNRPNVTVRSRTGYVAVQAPGVLPLLAYEGPALAALERAPLPADLPVRAGVFVFPQVNGAARAAIVVATPSQALTFESDESTGTFQTDFTVLARIRNARGEVVRKGSHPYRLSGPLAEIDNARHGEVLFFRQPELDTGVYTLDFIVHDALSQRAGAGQARVIVPAFKADGLRVSNLVIVQRAERVPADEQDPANPLYYGDLLLYPSLGEPVSKSAARALSFYVVAIPSPGEAPVSASIEVRSDGKSLAEVPLELAAPGPDGRIQRLTQLPLESFPPGTYELHVTVAQGSDRQHRAASFRVVD